MAERKKGSQWNPIPPEQDKLGYFQIVKCSMKRELDNGITSHLIYEVSVERGPDAMERARAAALSQLPGWQFCCFMV